MLVYQRVSPLQRHGMIPPWNGVHGCQVREWPRSRRRAIGALLGGNEGFSAEMFFLNAEML